MENNYGSLDTGDQQGQGANPEPGANLGEGLRASAQEFSRNVEEAAGRLGSAAQQFLTVTTNFVAANERLENALGSHREIEAGSQSAAGNAQTAAEAALAAAQRAEQVQASVEAMQLRMDSSYGELTSLIRDLQERIAALAVLARPLPETAAAAPEPEASQPETSSDQPASNQWSSEPSTESGTGTASDEQSPSEPSQPAWSATSW